MFNKSSLLTVKGESPLLTVLQRWHCSGVLCQPPGPLSGASAGLACIINNSRHLAHLPYLGGSSLMILPTPGPLATDPGDQGWWEWQRSHDWQWQITLGQPALLRSGEDGPVLQKGQEKSIHLTFRISPEKQANEPKSPRLPARVQTPAWLQDGWLGLPYIRAHWRSEAVG